MLGNVAPAEGYMLYTNIMGSAARPYSGWLHTMEKTRDLLTADRTQVPETCGLGTEGPGFFS